MRRSIRHRKLFENARVGWQYGACPLLSVGYLGVSAIVRPSACFWVRRRAWLVRKHPRLGWLGMLTFPDGRMSIRGGWNRLWEVSP